MSNNNTEEKKRLTIDDPVNLAYLGTFANLDRAKQKIALELLELEMKKIQFLAIVKKIDERHSALFDRILVDRGMDPATRVNLDTKTGKLTIISAPEAPTPPTEAEGESLDI